MSSVYDVLKLYTLKTHEEVEHHLISDAKKFIHNNLSDQPKMSDNSRTEDTPGRIMSNIIGSFFWCLLKKDSQNHSGYSFEPG